MIGLVRGTVFERFESKLVIETPMGVGYEIAIPTSAAYQTVDVGHSILLHIYSHIREDAFDLYGFMTRLEKELFLLVLSVNGVGPKLANALISKAEPQGLIRALSRGDKDFLTQIQGVGKKTAERLVLELEDKVKKKLEWAALMHTPSDSSVAKNKTQKGATTLAGTLPTKILNEAKTALMGLGFRENEVDQLIRQVLETHTTDVMEQLETVGPETIIKHALKLRGMG